MRRLFLTYVIAMTNGVVFQIDSEAFDLGELLQQIGSVVRLQSGYMGFYWVKKVRHKGQEHDLSPLMKDFQHTFSHSESTQDPLRLPQVPAVCLELCGKVWAAIRLHLLASLMPQPAASLQS